MKKNLNAYVSWKRNCHKHFLETQRPNIYELYDKNGTLKCTVFNLEFAKTHEKSGLKIKQVFDIDERIAILKNSDDD